MPSPSGSRRWFTYTDDEGNAWSVQLDESTYENTVLGFGQTLDSDALTNRRYLQVSHPGSIEPRYVLCRQQDGATPGRSQKFFIGSQTTTPWTGGTILSINGVTYSITSKVGEVRNYPPTVDTGLTDGDVDDLTPAAP